MTVKKPHKKEIGKQMKKPGGAAEKPNNRQQQKEDASRPLPRHETLKKASLSEKQERTAPVQGKPAGYLPWYILAGIIVLTAIVYSNSIHNGFTNWDDNWNVTLNTDIQTLSVHTIQKFFTSFYWNMYYPFTVLSFAIDHALGGLNPTVYHATNLILHLLNTLLVFQLMMALTKRYEIATLVALFFGIYPMNVEAVAWVSARNIMLYTVFFLGALISYLSYVRSHFQIQYLLLSLVLFLCSLFSKSAAVILPVVLLLFDYYESRKIDKKVFIEKIPFFALSLVFGLISVYSRSPQVLVSEAPPAYSVIERFFMGQYALAFYIIKLLVPFSLSALYPLPLKLSGFLPPQYYLAPVLILFIIFAIVKIKTKRKELVFGSGFFLINIALVLQLIPFGGRFIAADRYTYVPYIGLFFVIGQFYVWVSDGKFSYSRVVKPIVVAVLTSYTALFSIMTYTRNEVWKDSLTLWNDVLEKNPRVAVAYYNRGNTKGDLKDYNGAIADFTKAIELEPTHARACNNRGFVKEILQDHRGAIADFTKAIELEPTYTEAYARRGFSKEELHDYRGAIADYTKAIELNPAFRGAYRRRGIVKGELQHYEGAIADFTKAIELNPDISDTYNDRGAVKFRLQDYRGAMEDYSRVIQINPKDNQAYYNRGGIRLLLKDLEGSVHDFNKAIELDARFANAYAGRGQAKLSMGQKADACNDWQKAAQLGYAPAKESIRLYCR